MTFRPCPQRMPDQIYTGTRHQSLFVRDELNDREVPPDALGKFTIRTNADCDCPGPIPVANYLSSQRGPLKDLGRWLLQLLLLLQSGGLLSA
jgi:hypothetical protein